jgi:hypothetical protein
VSLRPVAALVLVALIAGAIAARADSGGAPRPARAPARVAPPPTRPFAAAVPPLAYGCAAPMAVNPKQPVPKPVQPKPSTAPPSQALLDAFAILRRARTDEDALASQAVQALRVRGLSPVSPDSARLLRTTPSGGKAWVVPVPDVVGRFDVFCPPSGTSGAREGLAVVAVGDAASGGGGALDDLVRGRSPVTVAPCAGAEHSMLSISGIVPNGVPAVFLTAPDGTAVRADVKDNGYEFLLPNQRSYEQRYVVWTGGDGTPHVQPVVTFGAVRASACKATTRLTQSMARVTPDGLFPCGTPRALNPKFVTPARRPSRAQLRRQAAQMIYVMRCLPGSAFVPGVVMGDRPVPVPPVAVLPGPVPAPSAVPARPRPAPAAPARPRKRR